MKTQYKLQFLGGRLGDPDKGCYVVRSKVKVTVIKFLAWLISGCESKLREGVMPGLGCDNIHRDEYVRVAAHLAERTGQRVKIVSTKPFIVESV